MIGKKFNRITVISCTDKKVGNKTIYHCKCECGSDVFTDKYKLISGHTKSCGCFKIENLSLIKFKHGMIKSPEYRAWVEMRQRCLNQQNASYKNYGGRGIKICERWIESFDNFFADMGYRPSINHSLDRIDVNGWYSPENCRWATTEQQQSNRRDTTKFLFNNEYMPLSHIARLTGIPQSTMQRLVISKKLSIEQVISSRLSRI